MPGHFYDFSIHSYWRKRTRELLLFFLIFLTLLRIVSTPVSIHREFPLETYSCRSRNLTIPHLET